MGLEASVLIDAGSPINAGSLLNAGVEVRVLINTGTFNRRFKAVYLLFITIYLFTYLQVLVGW